MGSHVSLWVNRSKYTIFFDILKALKKNGRMKKTHLMRKAMLSTNRFYPYIKAMKNLGLIGEHDHMFYATEKGLEVLKVGLRLEEMLNCIA